MLLINSPRDYFMTAIRRRSSRRRMLKSASAGLVRLESLEDRVLLTNYTVDTILDDASGVPDGFISLREAIIAADTNAAFGDAPAGMANGDTIDFDPTIANMTITLTNGEFIITEDLSIDGEANNITIDAGNASRIFNVDTSEVVSIANLTLINGTVAGNGGAISLTGGGTTNLAGLTITDSTASGDGGGAIFNDDHTLDITGSTISNNTADGVSGSGGGLLTNSGAVEIESTEISLNIANRAGGGIEVGEGSVTLINSQLNENVAGPAGTANPGNGGGLHVTSSNTTVIVQNTEVSGNSAAREGGGLWNADGSLMIVRGTSIIADNVAMGDAADDGGGGIFNNGGELRVFDSTVDNNSATGTDGSGGGIFSLDGRVVVRGSDITANDANRAGGGIEIVDGTLLIQDSNLGGSDPLDGNIAGPAGSANPGNGGGLHVTGVAVVNVRDSNVENNFAAKEGGGLWNQAGSTLMVLNSVVNNNTASGDDADDGGGGIFNNGGFVRVGGSSVEGNIADGTAGSGGGVFSTGGRLVVDRSNVSANTANRAGGGIEVIDGTVIIRNSDLGGFAAADGNVAGPAGSANPGNGGGLHVTGVADVTVENSFVRNNFAAKEGGGLWNQAGSLMRVINSTVSNNEAVGNAADDGGGGIFNNGGIVNVYASKILDNDATGTSGSGGGIFTTDGRVHVKHSLVEGNSANRAGGGIEIIDGFLYLKNTDLVANLAGPFGSANPGNGGGVHVTGSDAKTLIESSFVGFNIAAKEGGGLWNQEGSELHVIYSNVIGNEANGNATDDGGGGIFNNGGYVFVYGSKIAENSANGTSGSGGGIFSTDGNVWVARSKIVNNVANRAGGGVEIIDGDLTLKYVTLGWNVAGPSGFANPGNGGGLHVSGSDAYVDVLYSTVIGNFAAREGGGLWNQSGSTMNVYSSTLRENIAAGNASDDGGGAIFNNGGNLYVGYSTIVGNYATGYYGAGGGLHLASGGDVEIYETDILYNEANGNGGGIYNNGDLLLKKSKVVRNRAGGTGGGVYTDFNGFTNVQFSFVHFNHPFNFAGPGTVV